MSFPGVQRVGVTSDDGRVRVASKVEVADGIVQLELVHARHEGGDLPPWTPGAHIGLVLSEEFTRQYSLCGDIGDAATYRVAVLREPAGRGGSAMVHESLSVGDELSILHPRNNFELVEAESYLFVAGGVGITPLIPMIAEAERRGATWSLEYGGRSRSSMAYVTDLLERYPDRVHLYPFDEVGHIPLAHLLDELDPHAELYCCGPGPMLDAVAQQCEERRIDRLHVEHFKAETVQDDVGDIEFEVLLEASGRTLTVPVGTSILEVIERSGIPVDSSCREGTCGTCEVAVLAGKIDHRDLVLSDDERAAGDCMMVCVSRSFSAKLVLDV